jgi:hypothetical protein
MITEEFEQAFQRCIEDLLVFGSTMSRFTELGVENIPFGYEYRVVGTRCHICGSSSPEQKTERCRGACE